MAIRLSGVTRPKTLAEYQPYVDKVEAALAGRRFEIGGSVKRGKKVFKDLDYMVQVESEQEEEEVHQRMREQGWIPMIKRPYMRVYVIMEEDDAAEVDLFFVRKAQWGTAQLFLTGSKYWNDHIRFRLGKRGIHWNNVLWFENKQGIRYTFPTEQEALDFVDIKWQEPSKRDRGNPIYSSDGTLLKVL